MSGMAIPTVSIIIPTRNRRTYLIQAINSATDQTFSGVEILVCDNASDDGTRELMQQRDDIVYVRHRDNLGANDNIRSGLGLASGEYALVLSDDDVIESDFIESGLKELERDADVALYHAAVLVVNTDGDVLTTYGTSPTGGPGPHRCLASLISSNYVPFSACLFRMDHYRAIGGLRNVFQCDYDLWLRFLAAGYYAFSDPRPLGRYRYHQQSASRSVSEESVHRDLLEIYDHLGPLANPAAESERQWKIAWHRMLLGQLELRRGCFRPGLRHIVVALRSHPAEPSLWLQLLGMMVPRGYLRKWLIVVVNRMGIVQGTRRPNGCSADR